MIYHLWRPIQFLFSQKNKLKGKKEKRRAKYRSMHIIVWPDVNDFSDSKQIQI